MQDCGLAILGVHGHGSFFMRVPFFIFLSLPILLAGESFPVRIVAANLTSGNQQSYSPDNGNHSNPEGAGARILKGLKPDIVLIQEFNTTIPLRQWVNQTFGQNFFIAREEGPGIPNGIVSRFPIIESGEWDDPSLDNRDFVWARIALPDGSKLWAVSVHFYAKKSEVRAKQAGDLVQLLRDRVRPGDRVVVGGDFNIRGLDEACFRELEAVIAVPNDMPADHLGNSHTNGPRSRPYDAVLVDRESQTLCTPVQIGSMSFPAGLVFDSRIFETLAQVPPVQAADSAAPQMQHMAVVRDFTLTK